MLAVIDGQQKRKRGLALFGSALAVLLALPSTSAAGAFSFSNFSDASTLNFNGTAAIATNGAGDEVLRLTEARVGPGAAQAGSAFTNAATTLGTNGTFSTVFDFQMTPGGGIDDLDGQGADGITFVLQSLTSEFRGAPGGYLAYGGTDPALSNSIAIEFDTFFNEYIVAPQFVTNADIRDPDGNHVGVDLNGSVWSAATAAVTSRMNDADIWRAWIDYSGLTQTLEVRVSDSTDRPVDALLSYGIDLLALLGTDEVFVGFTGSDGGGTQTQDILSWSFSSAPTSSVPLPATAWLLAMGLLSLARRRRGLAS